MTPSTDPVAGRSPGARGRVARARRNGGCGRGGAIPRAARKWWRRPGTRNSSRDRECGLFGGVASRRRCCTPVDAPMKSRSCRWRAVRRWPGFTGVEGLDAQGADEGGDEVLVGNGAVRGEKTVRVLVVFSSSPMTRWATAAGRDDDFGVGTAQGREPDRGLRFEAVGEGVEARGLAVIERPHVGLGHRGDGAQDRFLAAAGAGPVPETRAS